MGEVLPIPEPRYKPITEPDWRAITADEHRRIVDDVRHAGRVRLQHWSFSRRRLACLANGSLPNRLSAFVHIQVVTFSNFFSKRDKSR
jgi:hypothetical protein